MYKKRIVLFICIVMLIFTGNSFADNSSIEKDKLNNVKNTIKDFKDKLSNNKEKEKNVTAQMNTLDAKIDNNQNEIENLNSKISQTKKNIEVAKKELEDATQQVTEQDDIMLKRLRAMYKNGEVGYMQVLLESDSVIDLLSNLDMVKKIFNQDMELLEIMKQRREEIDEKKKKLEAYERNLSIMISNMETKQKQLKIDIGEMIKTKELIKQDSKKFEKQIDELNAYANKLSEEIRRKQSTGKYVGGQLNWPAPGYTRITSPFGYRIHPILKRKKMHTGIDVGVPYGKTIVAAGDGKVIMANWYGGYGKAVMVDHGGGIVTLYAHNSTLLVKVGQNVKRGQAITKSGSTGNSTGPHLHFEVRKNGQYTDPLPWLKGR
ncbi:peptidoglycan DD-metalloendopeptidase family protein [Lutibacter sp. B2]|nr:peptidoglycan DD-metalloendopeptidase family protein [Lutibacter sp. B2]